MLNKIKKIILKKNKSKIICLTSYSKNFAEEIDGYVDIILVGDSLGSVLYNYNTTRKVTFKNMKEHTKCVRMGVKKRFMVINMQYKTYRKKREALKNAKKIIKETKCEAVKLEGGTKIINIVKHLRKNKISVMGHLGILPQSIKGKFKSKGKTEKEKAKLLKEAKLLEDAGAFAIVLECVKTITSKLITNSIKIPTVGIGSSVYCDGQVLVTDDMLGLNKANVRFVKKFVNLKKVINEGVKKFKKEVLLKKYPTKKYSYN